MHESMVEEIAENRGYDRGFTAGTKHAHDLLSNYVQWFKDYRAVLEDEGGCSHDVNLFQKHINVLENAKLLVRKGHWDSDEARTG
jgi:hypothetical protein